MSNARAGLLALVVVVCGTYLGFAKALPWSGGYEVKAVFASANELHGNSPVRIAGVNVGKVVGLERGPGRSAVVTMRISDAGRPLRRDATLKIRPRIFLEGNFFVDVRPGTGAAPELRDGETIPLSQTATPVQLDEVLQTLDTDTRGNLQHLLEDLSETLDRGGAAALKGSLPSWRPAFAGSAIAAEALRGTEADDLSATISSQARLMTALARHREALARGIGGFAQTSRALASRQAELGATVRGLAATARVAYPALGRVNAALPALRRFATGVRPALREAPATLDLAIPLVTQLAGLVGEKELPGVVGDLQPAVRRLVTLQPRLVALLDRVTPVTDCVRDTALPVLRAKLDDGHLSTGRAVWQELMAGMVGLASASQDFDGTGHVVRYHGGYGDQLFSTGQVPQAGQLFGLSPEPLLGSRPPHPGPGKQPPFKPSVPCKGQTLPNLKTGSTPPPVRAARR